MTIASKMATLFRGDVPLQDLPRELLRRRRAASHRAAERRVIDALNDVPARLADELSELSTKELLEHFRNRPYSFFHFGDDGDDPIVSEAVDRHFPGETDRLTAAAARISDERSWELAGFGEITFDAENIWRSDPFSHEDWGLDYHADVVVYRQGGPDIRVLWEMNRLGHLVTLGLAYAVSAEERFAETFFRHIEGWMQENPYGRGANWNCAMEVALRAINVLAAFDILRRSAACTEERLLAFLRFFDQHGRFIVDNNEFSYIGTSNHYLSDVVGLFWIGTMLPELEHSAVRREFGRREMLRETEKQVLADGADFEASTGYHKFVTEMLLYSHLLAKRNGVEMPRKFGETIHRMLLYINGIIRPDGKVPLIGDADGSQIVPVVRRDADDQAYLLSLGAAIFKDSDLKEFAVRSAELFWLFGEKGIDELETLDRPQTPASSRAFPDAGSYVMRDGDLYLHFDTSDIGAKGRGSHGHNDALAIEISAFGHAFIVDPGSNVYNLDRGERHRFRSTAFHSTVMVDGIEQNTTNLETPFIMGNEASPKILSWETSADRDRVEGLHNGYKRLADPVIHHRTVEFDKAGHRWELTDKFVCILEHEFSFRLHFAPGVKLEHFEEGGIRASHVEGGELIVLPNDHMIAPVFEHGFVSRSYGDKRPSTIACWTFTSTAGHYRWEFISGKTMG